MPQHRRVAVDQIAKDYWGGYFGDYGKKFTEDVPRRVVAAIIQRRRKAEAKRSAAEGKGRAGKVVRAQVGPLGWAKTATGGLLFEGIFRGFEKGGKTPIIETFAAEFDARGTLTDLTTIQA